MLSSEYTQVVFFPTHYDYFEHTTELENKVKLVKKIISKLIELI